MMMLIAVQQALNFLRVALISLVLQERIVFS